MIPFFERIFFLAKEMHYSKVCLRRCSKRVYSDEGSEDGGGAAEDGKDILLL